MSPRDRGGHEPRDRRPAVHRAQHRRLPPTQSVPQARSQVPPPTQTAPAPARRTPNPRSEELTVRTRLRRWRDARRRLCDRVGAPLGRACMPPIITPPRCSSSPPASGGGGGEQSLPPRSAAIKSARARGLADLIDNLGAALPAAAVFLSTARVAAKYPSAGDLHSRGGATFRVAPPETRLARISGLPGRTGGVIGAEVNG